MVNDNSELLQEILLLGGNKEDLEFIKDVGDGDLMEFGPGKYQKEKMLKNDVERMILEFKVENDISNDSISLNDVSNDSNQISLKQPDITTLDKLSFAPSSAWYDFSLPDIPQISAKKRKISQLNVDSKRKILKTLFELASKYASQEAMAYEKTQKNSSDFSFFQSLVKTGTMNDKISAISLAIQESPLHMTKYFDHLMNIAHKKSRRESLQAVEALVDLYLTGLLPDKRKLKVFSENSQLDKLCEFIDSKNCSFKVESAFNKNQLDALKPNLIFWFVEDFIKAKYFELITIIDRLSRDTVQNIRIKCVEYAYTMLNKKPEQEKTLLSFLVNKLGDTNRQVSSKAVHLLKLILKNHPKMKKVIALEVQRLVLRSNESERSRYFGLVLLSQFFLSHRSSDLEVARLLVKIYMKMFEQLIKAGSKSLNPHKSLKDVDNAGIDSKMMSAILTGLSRAIPYLSTSNDDEIAEEQFKGYIDWIFKLVHSPTVSIMTSTQSLQIISLILWRPRKKEDAGTEIDDSAAVFSPKLADRFYRALYASIISERHASTSKHHALYLNLLYKAMTNDSAAPRVIAFIKRLLQACTSDLIHGSKDVGFVCGSLIVINEVLKKNNTAKNLFACLLSANESGGIDEYGEDDENYEQEQEKAYDPMHRSPEYANADKTNLWELLPLCVHYHPTVCLFAKKLLDQTGIRYPSDPLKDFTLSSFLDKFVYRNPKKTSEIDEESMGNKPRAGMSSILREKLQMNRSKNSPVNSSDWQGKYANADANSVPVDEQFYHTYFNLNGFNHAKEDELDIENLDDMQLLETVMDDDFEDDSDIDIPDDMESNEDFDDEE